MNFWLVQNAIKLFNYKSENMKESLMKCRDVVSQRLRVVEDADANAVRGSTKYFKYDRGVIIETKNCLNILVFELVRRQAKKISEEIRQCPDE